MAKYRRIQLTSYFMRSPKNPKWYPKENQMSDILCSVKISRYLINRPSMINKFSVDVNYKKFWSRSHQNTVIMFYDTFLLSKLVASIVSVSNNMCHHQLSQGLERLWSVRYVFAIGLKFRSCLDSRLPNCKGLKAFSQPLTIVLAFTNFV